MRFRPLSKGHRIVLVVNDTPCDDIDDSVNVDVIVVCLTMIEAIYAVLEECNRGNNDTMLDLDLDVDLIVSAIKDGRFDIELKSRGPTVEVVSLRPRLVSPRPEKNSKSHSRTMFTIPYSRKYSSDTHHPSYAILCALRAVCAGLIFNDVAQLLYTIDETIIGHWQARP